jgi:hypothetical protein
MGATWGQHFTGYKLGTQDTRTPKLALERSLRKEKILNELGSLRLSLIKHYMWGQLMNT